MRSRDRGGVSLVIRTRGRGSEGWVGSLVRCAGVGVRCWPTWLRWYTRAIPCALPPRYAFMRLFLTLLCAAVLLFAGTDHVRAEAPEAPVAVLYDVRDLTVQIRDFAAPRVGLDAPRTAAGGPEGRGEARSLDDLIELIEAQVSPNTWGAKGHRIAKFRGTLVIATTGDVHRKIRAFLARL